MGSEASLPPLFMNKALDFVCWQLPCVLLTNAYHIYAILCVIKLRNIYYNLNQYSCFLIVILSKLSLFLKKKRNNASLILLQQIFTKHLR